MKPPVGSPRYWYVCRAEGGQVVETRRFLFLEAPVEIYSLWKMWSQPGEQAVELVACQRGEVFRINHVAMEARLSDARGAIWSMPLRARSVWCSVSTEPGGKPRWRRERVGILSPADARWIPAEARR